jgi:hypothetical protein
MRVEAGERTFRGRAIDLREASITSSNAVAAVRSDGESSVLDIDCPEPGPAHEHVGYIESGMSIRARPAVAAAARSVGINAPQDEEITEIEESFRSLNVEGSSLRTERRRVAEVSGSETELRERVATLRGRVQALRDFGEDSEEAESKLRSATRELAETATERIAAEQALEDARERQRSTRNTREQRLRLRDRRANLERAARGYLVRQVHKEFVAAVEVVPDGEQERCRVTKPGSFEGDPTTAALAIARLARIRAPVVLACDVTEFVDAIARVAGEYDHVIIDCPAGMSADAGLPLVAADSYVLVTIPRPFALADAVRTKALARRLDAGLCRVVLNRVREDPPVAPTNAAVRFTYTNEDRFVLI